MVMLGRKLQMIDSPIARELAQRAEQVMSAKSYAPTQIIEQYVVRMLYVLAFDAYERDELDTALHYCQQCTKFDSQFYPSNYLHATILYELGTSSAVSDSKQLLSSSLEQYDICVAGDAYRVADSLNMQGCVCVANVRRNNIYVI